MLPFSSFSWSLGTSITQQWSSWSLSTEKCPWTALAWGIVSPWFSMKEDLIVRSSTAWIQLALSQDSGPALSTTAKHHPVNSNSFPRSTKHTSFSSPSGRYINNHTGTKGKHSSRMVWNSPLKTNQEHENTPRQVEACFSLMASLHKKSISSLFFPTTVATHETKKFTPYPRCWLLSGCAGLHNRHRRPSLSAEGRPACPKLS